MMKFIILITLAAAYCLAAPLSNDIEDVSDNKTGIEKDDSRKQKGEELEPLSRELLNNIFSRPFKTPTVLPSGQEVYVIHQGPFPIIFKPVLASTPTLPASASDSIVASTPSTATPTSSTAASTSTIDAATSSKEAPDESWPPTHALTLSAATTAQSSVASANARTQSTDASNPSTDAFKSSTDAPTLFTTSPNAARQSTAQSS